MLGWRDVPVDPDALRPRRPRACAPHIAPAVRRRRRRRRDQDALRAQALRDPPRASSTQRIDRPRDPELLVAHDRLQGDARRPRSCRASSPTCATSALESRAGARALALLDQHLPELGARAPVPDARPQRRDQHAARQPQLDARARGRSSPRRCSATDLDEARAAAARRPCSDSATLDARVRAAGARRPLARARDLDADPRGLRGPRRSCRSEVQRLLRLPRAR